MSDLELQQLTWRFAAMIGIVQPNPDYATAEEVASDRNTWPHLIVKEDGDPVFDFDRCAEWMAELSGDGIQRCRKIVFKEWGDEEDRAHA